MIFSIQISHSQKEATYWFFGQKAGLDFTSGQPKAYSDGSLITDEGCASMSNSEGALLFYTDGSTVWNQRHEVMPTGINLKGNSTSTQSAIIVPKPNDSDIYFIFTIDWGGGVHGLNYYTLDMKLDNGLGDVVGYNGIPISTNLLTDYTGEKITAVKVLGENAYWVLSYQEGSFFVYKVDQDGVNSTPVAGNTRFHMALDARGYLKISPDGKKLVSAHATSGTYLYDFDDSKGFVSNERKLNLQGNFGYGAEFSPLSRKLYITTGNYQVDGSKSEELLYQFNLDVSDPTALNINGSRVELHSYQNRRSALQLGLNGKIYRARNNQSFLGIINDPDADGLAANYVHDGISLKGRISMQGLPPFIQSFFIGSVIVENQCLGQETSFEVSSNEEIINILWDFGDGSETSDELYPNHIFDEARDYTVTVHVETENEIKTLQHFLSIHELPVVNSPVELKQCDNDQDGITSFNLKQSEILIGIEPDLSYSYHLKEHDAMESKNAIDDPTVFVNNEANQIFVRVENKLNCYSLAILNLDVSVSAIPKDFKLAFQECDTNIIDGDDSNGITTFDFSSATQEVLSQFPSNQALNVTYYRNREDALALKNPINSEEYRNDDSPFTSEIVVRVDNIKNNECMSLDYHIELIVLPIPEFFLVNHRFLCLNQLPNPIIVFAENPENSYSYEWRDSSGRLLTSNNTSFLEVTEKGDYFLTAISDKQCDRTKRITVEESNIATIISVDILDVSENNSITVHISGAGDYEFALDDSNGPYRDENFFDEIYGGSYTVYVRDKNNCGIQSKRIVVLNIPKFFTPNEDGINDTWQIDGAFSQPDSKVYVFDKFGKVLKRIEALGNGWDGNYNGNPMPSTDYWYLAELEDGRVYKGHFSLIRN